jgi:hypothetical protein
LLAGALATWAVMHPADPRWNHPLTLLVVAGMVAFALALVVTLFFGAPSRRLRLLVRELRRTPGRASM